MVDVKGTMVDWNIGFFDDFMRTSHEQFEGGIETKLKKVKLRIVILIKPVNKV